jgi:hypothetical protein
MTFPTANVRIKTGSLGLLAICADLDPALKCYAQRTDDLTV